MNQSLVNLGKKIVPFPLRLKFRKMNRKAKYKAQAKLVAPGTSVFCPIARKEYKCFIPDGNDLISPDSGARARQRVLWLFYQRETRIFTDKISMLHVAPELHFFEVFNSKENIDYFPGDKMVDGYSNQKGVNNIDLTDLALEDDRFDYLICNHVLEHIPNDTKAMSEMYRVLKEGGEAILTVPLTRDITNTNEDKSINTPELRKKHFGQWDHVRQYGTDISRRLEDAGFKVDLISYKDEFSKEDIEKYGLNDEIIIRCQKS
jgi:SAM-dependent methyltransferase